jgi:hypothetical protein
MVITTLSLAAVFYDHFMLGTDTGSTTAEVSHVRYMFGLCSEERQDSIIPHPSREFPLYFDYSATHSARCVFWQSLTN